MSDLVILGAMLYDCMGQCPLARRCWCTLLERRQYFQHIFHNQELQHVEYFFTYM